MADESTTGSTGPSGPSGQDTMYLLCPYCGQLQSRGERCVTCLGMFEPLSRMATQIAMGPWQIRDKKIPYRPGCSLEVIKKQIQAGKIKATTAIRGPSTRQFWSLARNTPGIAHLLGICYQCGEHFAPGLMKCPKCKTRFTEISDRNALGLMYPTDADVAAARKKLNAEIARQMGTTEQAVEQKVAEVENIGGDSEDRLPGMDLLDEIIGPGAAGAAGKAAHGRAGTAVPDPDESSDSFDDDPEMPWNQDPLGHGKTDMPAHAARPMRTAARSSMAGGAAGAPGKSGSASAPSGRGEALDFAPGSTSEHISVEPLSTVEASPPKRGRGVIVMLIAFNIIAVLVIVVLVLMTMNQRDAAARRAPESTQQATGLADGIANGTLTGPTGGALATADTTGAAAVTMSAADQEWLAAQLGQARSMLQQGRAGEALALLRNTRQSPRISGRPAELQTMMRQVETQVARQQAAEFFQE